jgi:hypothetical protein
MEVGLDRLQYKSNLCPWPEYNNLNNLSYLATFTVLASSLYNAQASPQMGLFPNLPSVSLTITNHYLRPEVA